MITINTKEFKSALNNCKTCLPRRSKLPILNNVRLESKGCALECSTTNLERGIVQVVGGYCEYGSPIRTTVPLKELADYVSKARSEIVTLEIDGKHLVLDGKVKLLTTDADDFPPIPELDRTASVVCDMNIDDAAAVAHAASTDDARPVLMGVLMGKGTMAATDGFRIALRHTYNDHDDVLNIPADTIRAIVKTKESGSLPVRMIDNAGDYKQASIELSSGYLVTALIDGNFPDWEAVVPRETTILTLFDRAELMDAISMIAAVSKKDTPVLRMYIGAEGCTLKNSIDTESPIELSVKCNSNYNIEIGINYDFLMDVLKLLHDDTVLLQFNTNNTPIMIIEVRHTEVIMPMRLE